MLAVPPSFWGVTGGRGRASHAPSLWGHARCYLLIRWALVLGLAVALGPTPARLSALFFTALGVAITSSSTLATLGASALRTVTPLAFAAKSSTFFLPLIWAARIEVVSAGVVGGGVASVAAAGAGITSADRASS